MSENAFWCASETKGDKKSLTAQEYISIKCSREVFLLFFSFCWKLTPFSLLCHANVTVRAPSSSWSSSNWMIIVNFVYIFTIKVEKFFVLSGLVVTFYPNTHLNTFFFSRNEASMKLFYFLRFIKTFCQYLHSFWKAS